MNPPPRRPDDARPLSDLPVAEPVGPDPDDLPVAVPVRPPAVRRDRGRDRERPRRPSPPSDPEPRDDGPPRPRVVAACGVIGCLGLGVVAAVGFLAYGAVLILSHLGERAAAPEPPVPGPVPADPPAAAARPAPPVREPHGPIAPTKLATPSATVQIGGVIDAAVRAGGGRYLLFRLRGQNRVVAFDANAGAMVPGWEIKLDEPGAMIAGGKDHLWVYGPVARELVRYDLETGRADRRAAVPAGDEAEAVAAGAGSDGPVYLVGPHGGGTRVRRWDGDSLRRGRESDYDRPLGEWLRARASDDGRVLALAGRDGAAVGRAAGPGGMTFSGLKTQAGFSPILAAPAPDGKWVYTPNGVYAPDGRLALPPASGAQFFYTIPPADGGEFFLHQDVDNRALPSGPLYAHRSGDQNHLGPVKWVESTAHGSNVIGLGLMSAAEQIFFWPSAGLIATMPDNSTLRLQKVDVAALRAARGD